VTKTELGTKRICSNCNSKFYDLHKSPIVCPTCKTVFEASSAISERPRRPWEERTAPTKQPTNEYARPDTVPGDASDEGAGTAKETDEEIVGIDADFENLEKE
jgi:uncharacterized protein (TIGR02300 family)